MWSHWVSKNCALMSVGVSWFASISIMGFSGESEFAQLLDQPARCDGVGQAHPRASWLTGIEVIALSWPREGNHVEWRMASSCSGCRMCWYPWDVLSLSLLLTPRNKTPHTLAKFFSIQHLVSGTNNEFWFSGLIRHTLKKPERSLPLIRIYVSSR